MAVTALGREVGEWGVGGKREGGESCRFSWGGECRQLTLRERVHPSLAIPPESFQPEIPLPPDLTGHTPLLCTHSASRPTPGILGTSAELAGTASPGS